MTSATRCRQCGHGHTPTYPREELGGWFCMPCLVEYGLWATHNPDLPPSAWLRPSLAVLDDVDAAAQGERLPDVTATALSSQAGVQAWKHRVGGAR